MVPDKLADRENAGRVDKKIRLFTAITGNSMPTKRLIENRLEECSENFFAFVPHGNREMHTTLLHHLTFLLLELTFGSVCANAVPLRDNKTITFPDDDFHY